MKEKNKILVFGGRGFLGSQVCKLLGEENVYTFDTNAGEENHFQGDICDIDSIKQAMKGVETVINLIGLSPLRQPKNVSYKQIHVQGVKNIISSCEQFNIRNFIHISALGADMQSSVEYLKTKSMAEEIISNSSLQANIIRPALIFDDENEFIKILKRTAFICCFPFIQTKMQPIYRQDIAKLIVLCVENKIKEKIILAGGPDIFTVFEIAKKIYNKKGYPCLGLPEFFFKIGVQIAIFFKLFGLTQSQKIIMSLDNTAQPNLAKQYIALTSFDKWVKEKMN